MVSENHLSLWRLVGAWLKEAIHVQTLRKGRLVCVYGEGQGQGVRDLDDLYRSNSAHKPKLMPDFGSLEKKNDVWAWLAIVACFSVGVCG